MADGRGGSQRVAGAMKSVDLVRRLHQTLERCFNLQFSKVPHRISVRFPIPLSGGRQAAMYYTQFKHPIVASLWDVDRIMDTVWAYGPWHPRRRPRFLEVTFDQSTGCVRRTSSIFGRRWQRYWGQHAVFGQMQIAAGRRPRVGAYTDFAGWVDRCVIQDLEKLRI